MTQQGDSKYILQTVKNAARILNLFTVERNEWRLTEISRELDLEISHTRRLINTLVQENLLKKKEKKYSLGLSILNMSGLVKSQLNIHLEARPILLPLVDQFSKTIHLGILDDIGVVYLDILETSHPIRMSSQIGKPHPVYSTSCGKIILSYQTEEILEEILEKVEQQGIIKSASKTVTDLDELRSQLKEIRRTGYAVTCDELEEGITSIGAPIYNYNGEVIAAAAITGSSKELGGNQKDLYISSIVKAAKEISKKIGFDY
ncbi:IclR family transcriptional regulator [Niallia oryzisoli]|uniref:IclR family transcriptional regulator n=1 Tax=Niallia oryzisoli TaxID=1737571 RepID=A0ABZ2C9S3_9BACI